jgi:opacity protein-like surface antigen
MPIMLNFRFYPFLPRESRYYPYLLAGAGLFYGRRSVQFVEINDPFYNELNEEDRYAFNYTLAAGVDWVLSHSLGLEFQVRYLPVSFSKNLALIRDYEAVAFTVGIKYLHYQK